MGEQKSSATLTVTEGTGVHVPKPKQDLPPRIEIDETLITQTIELNKKWRVDCRYRGHPKPEISWFKNGKTITTTETCVINTDHTSSTIVINKVDHEDTGLYKIKATNKLGEDSKDLNLTVIGK